MSETLIGLIFGLICQAELPRHEVYLVAPRPARRLCHIQVTHLELRHRTRMFSLGVCQTRRMEKSLSPMRRYGKDRKRKARLTNNDK